MKLTTKKETQKNNCPKCGKLLNFDKPNNLKHCSRCKYKSLINQNNNKSKINKSSIFTNDVDFSPIETNKLEKGYLLGGNYPIQYMQLYFIDDNPCNNIWYSGGDVDGFKHVLHQEGIEVKNIYSCNINW